MYCYLLDASVLGLGVDDRGDRQTVRLPAGVVFSVLGHVPGVPVQNPTDRVSVLWRGQVVSLLTSDVQERGKPVRAA